MRHTDEIEPPPIEFMVRPLASDPLGPARESTSALPGETGRATEQALPGNTTQRS
jgi:hypothetical protein